MASAKASGYSLSATDIPFVLGMEVRGDRNHDIACWFGVNQGRIKEAKDGRFGTVIAAPPEALPPKGSPGIKGRRLRESVQKAVGLLDKRGADASEEVLGLLKDASAQFDTNEA